MPETLNLFARPDLCTGCQCCTYACSAAKNGRFVPSRARLQISNFAQHGFSVPHICFHCPKPLCFEACPHGAMQRTGNGVVEVDTVRCQSCGACRSACPYGMVGSDSEGRAEKCDLCAGAPACAHECAYGALRYSAADPDLTRERAAQMKERGRTANTDEKRRHVAGMLLRRARPELVGK